MKKNIKIFSTFISLKIIEIVGCIIGAVILYGIGEWIIILGEGTLTNSFLDYIILPIVGIIAVVGIIIVIIMIFYIIKYIIIKNWNWAKKL